VSEAALAGQLDTGWWKICKRICKRTTQHSMARRITRQHCHRKNGEQEHSYYATRASMRIIELENRCTGNRTVGSKRVANDKARELRVDRKRSSVSAVKRQEVGGLGRRLLRASFDATRAFAVGTLGLTSPEFISMPEQAPFRQLKPGLQSV
jgi:hypothetical protein